MKKRFEDLNQIERRNIYGSRLFALDDQKLRSIERLSNIVPEEVNIDSYIISIQKLKDTLEVMDDLLDSTSAGVVLNVAKELTFQLSKVIKMSKILVDSKLGILTRNNLTRIIKELEDLFNQFGELIKDNFEEVSPDIVFTADLEALIDDSLAHPLRLLFFRIVDMFSELNIYLGVFKGRQRIIGKGSEQIPRKYM